jgi:hypothetical protein
MIGSSELRNQQGNNSQKAIKVKVSKVQQAAAAAAAAPVRFAPAARSKLQLQQPLQ